MTEPTEQGTTPPDPGSLADEPIPEGEGGASSDAASSNGRAREWMAQLEAMIQEIATQAAPVARQVAAKAAELTAVAAAKAGPIAQRAAEVTTDAGQRLAERAEALAVELRRGPPDAEAPETPAPPTTTDEETTPSA